METLLLIAGFAAASLHAQTPAPAGPADLRTLLRDALFEEEATRDLAKAAAGYEALLTKWGEQRQFAAAALFRLAEVRRKQDRKDDAIKLYQRLVTEFADQEPHARLSRENLAALGAKEPSPSAPATPTVSDEEAVALARVQKLAVQSPDLLTRQEFTTACSKGWLSVVKFLISKEVSDKEGQGLQAAAATGHLAIVRELLPLKPFPTYAASAVAAAANSNRLAVLKLLLENGASPDSPDGGEEQFPPLWLALDEGHTEAAELLLAHKASADPAGAVTPPLFAASRTGNAPMVQRLLSLKADPNRATRPLRTPENSNPPKDLLIEPNGSTPLHAAVASGSAECVNLLLAANANINATNDAGWTPLHGAAREGNTALIERLIVAGAAADGGAPVAGKERRSPLWFAIASGKAEAVAALLKGKANPNFLHSGNTAMALAIRYEFKARDEIIALLLEHGADPTAGERSAIQDAPTALKLKLLRGYQYPKLAAKPKITLVFGDHGVENVLSSRSSPDEKPAPLPSLLLAWHDRGGWNATGNMQTGPDWSTLRLFRKGDGGKMTETVVPVKAGAEFPALQWGDVIEVVSNDPPQPGVKIPGPDGRVTVLPGGPPSRSAIPGLPGEVIALLRDTQSARIKFTANGITRDLTLRGHLRTWNPLSNEAPLVPLSVLAGWCAGLHPEAAGGKEVMLRRSGESGGGEARYLLTDHTLASMLPRDGDEITLLEPEKASRIQSGIGFSSPGQQFGGILPNDGTTLFRLLAILYAAPPPGTWPADVFAADGTVADPAALPAKLDPFLRFRVLSHPDLSKIRLRKVDEPAASEVDLLALAASLPADATPQDARKLDIPLLNGSVVFIPTLPDTAAPWTGLPENVERLLILAHAARVTFDASGNLRSAELRWHPARFVSTPAGLLPVPAPGPVPEGTFRLPALTVGDSTRAVMGDRLTVTQIVRPGVEENRGSIDPGSAGWLTDGDQITLKENALGQPGLPVIPRPSNQGQSLPSRPPAANTTRIP